MELEGLKLSMLALATFVVCIVYIIGRTAYNLFFHPLAGFPGPKLAAASYLYEFYYELFHGLGARYWVKVDELHRKYGPIIRINPNELHINDPDWFDIAYPRHPIRRDKYPPFANMLGTKFGVFGTVDHDLHRARRAASNPFFSSRSVAASEYLIGKHLERLCKIFRQSFENKGVLELRAKFTAFTLDILCDFAFADCLDVQNDAVLSKKFDDSIVAIGIYAPYAKQFPWMIQGAMNLPIALFVYERAVKTTEESAVKREVVLENEKGWKRPATVYDSIRNSKLPPEDRTIHHLAHDGVELLLAGSGPTARTIMQAFFHLLDNPLAMERLQKELDQAMPDPATTPPYKELEELPWLNAVVKEAMRVTPVVSTRLPQMPHEESRYKQWVIPPMTPLSMSPRDLLLNPSIYPEPEKFKPERWLRQTASGGNDEKGIDLDKFFVPFGKGGRACQGMNFAMTEVFITLATLIRRFKFALYDTVRERDVDMAKDCFMAEPRPGSVGTRVRVLGVRE